jgi:hypothetical protein
MPRVAQNSLTYTAAQTDGYCSDPIIQSVAENTRTPSAESAANAMPTSALGRGPRASPHVERPPVHAVGGERTRSYVRLPTAREGANGGG